MLDRIALGAAALLCFLPFLVGTHGDLVPTFYAELLAAAIGLGVALVLCDRHTSIGVHGMAMGLAVLTLVLALQVAFGLVAFPERNALAALYAMWAGLLVIAGAELRERFGLERVVFVLQYAFAAAGFFLAITGLMQRYGIQVLGLSITGPEQMIGLLGQRNHLANLLSCGLASILFLTIERRAPLRIALLVAAPIVLALSQNGSRSPLIYAWLILFAAMLRPSRFATRASVSLALVLLVLALASGSESAQRIAATMTQGDPQRWVLARYGWAVFTSAPWLGVGWGELSWHALQRAPEVGVWLGDTRLGHVHNLVLQLAAETGIAGAAAIALPLAAWFWRFPWRTASPGHCWVLAITSVELFHGLVELPQWYAHLLGPFALLLGVGSASTLKLAASRTARLAVGVAIAAGAVAIAACLAQYRTLERWRAEAEAGHPTPELLQRLVDQRGGLFGWRIEALLALAVEPGPAALPLVEQALHGHPQQALVERYAKLLDLAGRTVEAARIRAGLAVLVRAPKS